MRHLLFTLVFFVAMTAHAASTKDFLVTLPGQWQPTETPNSELQIFRNVKSGTNQIVVAQLIKYPKPSEMSASELVEQQASIAKLRDQALRPFAIGHYRIHAMEIEPSSLPEFQNVIVIEASYRSLDHRDVQVIERQYIARNRMVQITYSEEAADLGSRDRIRNVLDNVKPRVERRSAATRIGDWLAGGFAHASEVVGTSNTSTATSAKTGATDGDIPITEAKKPDAKQIEDFCGTVPESVRAAPGDKEPSIKETAITCKDQMVSVVKSIGKQIWEVGSNPGELMNGLKEKAKSTVQFGKDVYRYATDPAFQAEKNTTAMAVIEAVKNPSETVKEAFNNLYNYLSKSDPPFACYKPKLQVQMLCNSVASLGAEKIMSFLPKVAATGAIESVAAKALNEQIKAAQNKILSEANKETKVATGISKDELGAEGLGQGPNAPKARAPAAANAEAANGGSASPTAASASTSSTAPNASTKVAAESAPSAQASAKAASGGPKLSRKNLSAEAKKFLTEVAKGDRKRYLNAASKLSDKDRTDVTEVLLKKDLSQADKDLILKAHRVGEGKDYYEKGSGDSKRLSHTDLREKVGTLKETSLSKDEQKMPMQLGITGGRRNDYEEIKFSDPNAVRANRMSASQSRTPNRDAEQLMREGHTEEANAHYREAATREARKHNYVGAQEASVRAGDIGEAALTLRGSQERINDAMSRAQKEYKRLSDEQDNRSITNKGSEAHVYYQNQLRNQEEWMKQLRIERQLLRDELSTR